MFDSAQTRSPRVNKLPLMSTNTMEIAAAVPETAHLWPWWALGGILLVLVVISRMSRRLSPFGL
jgi:hypothetical protein